MDMNYLKTQYKHAELLFIMKEFEDALDVLEELLQHLPNNPELLLAKIKCLAAMGFREEAKSLCRQLMESCQNPHVLTLWNTLCSNEVYSPTV